MTYAPPYGTSVPSGAKGALPQRFTTYVGTLTPKPSGERPHLKTTDCAPRARGALSGVSRPRPQSERHSLPPRHLQPTTRGLPLSRGAPPIRLAAPPHYLGDCAHCGANAQARSPENPATPKMPQMPRRAAYNMHPYPGSLPLHVTKS